MTEQWIALNSLPAEGREFVVDAPEVWDAPLDEFGLDCRVREPLRAGIFLLPQEEGVLVRGHLTGSVILRCDLCAEDAVHDVDQRFESFEAFPGIAREEEINAPGDEDELEDSAIRLGEDGPEINLAALAWEEFSLALPVHPMCRTECAGLCVSCGKNLNEGPCGCTQDEGDPRLAVLRNLRVNS